MDMTRSDASGPQQTDRLAGQHPDDRHDRVHHSRYRLIDQRSTLLRDHPTLPWVIVIAILLSLGTLYIASSLFVPLAIATLAYLTLRPITARLCKFGLSKPIAAGLIICGLFFVVAAIATLLYDPMQSWLTKAPASVGQLKQNLESIADPLTAIDRAEESINIAGQQVGADGPPVEVQLKKPSVIDPAYLINTTGHLLAFIAAIAVLTFFMLSSGDDLLNRILNVLRDDRQRTQILATISDVQDNVGSYLGQISLINTGLGAAVTFVMWSVGMPTPILWGVMAALLNFIPYVGPIAGTAIVLIAASTVFDSFPRAFGTAAAFWLTTAIEGQFVTPMVIGKTLKVGSLVVLIAVAFWGFVWGLPGIFLAVPLLIVMREIFSSFQSTYPLAVVLGENACKPGQACDPVQDDKPIAELV